MADIWTLRSLALLFCALNLVYIPGAFLVHPSVSDILHQGLIPNFAGGSTASVLLLNGQHRDNDRPWMLFFQQSAVVDKGMLEKDIRGPLRHTARLDHYRRRAVFIVIVTGTVLPGIDIDSAAQAASELMKTDRYVGTFLAIGLFDAGLLGAICISLASSWAFGEIFGWLTHSTPRSVRRRGSMRRTFSCS